MISKELLTALRGDDYTVLDIDYSELEDNKIGYLLNNNQWYYINIYELAHKCKEWAYKQGYRFTIEEDKIKIAIKKDLTYYLTTITQRTK